jgi:hypothetical protein
MPVKLGFIILSLIGVLRIPEEFYLYKDKRQRQSRVLSFIFYWFGMVRRKLTIPEKWQTVGMHSGGFSHRRVADHFRVNHSIIV